MKLLFPETKISHYARRYPVCYDEGVESLVPQVKRRGYLTRSELVKLANWVAPGRNESRVLSNSCEVVEEMTELALRGETERSRIQHSVKLKGVAFTTASVILHWFHSEDYPIWSKYARTAVEFEGCASLLEQERWEAFVSFCREVVSRNPITMRELDRALSKLPNHRR